MLKFTVAPKFLIVVAFLSAGSVHTATAATPDDLFKEAQLQEMSARDMDAAIRLYQEYLLQPGTDRAHQAAATLRLGMCEMKLGRRAEAKAVWKKIVQDYSDQTESYAEALNQLQQLQSLEQSEVVPSTPVVRVVYETPPARWMVEFPKATFARAIDGKGSLSSTASGISIALSHYPEPDLGVLLELGSLGSDRPLSTSRDIGFFNTSARAEKTITTGFRLYGQGGPGLYFFQFHNDQKSETKFNIGASLGAGVLVGLPRGFTFNFGYALHIFGQSTPSKGFRSSIPTAEVSGNEDLLQNHGVRLMGGPVVALSFRW